MQGFARCYDLSDIANVELSSSDSNDFEDCHQQSASSSSIAEEVSSVLLLGMPYPSSRLSQNVLWKTLHGFPVARLGFSAVGTHSEDRVTTGCLDNAFKYGGLRSLRQWAMKVTASVADAIEQGNS
ncbi:hypothetical protein GCM10027562_33240 [Arthrobacter pigmenti]